MAQVVVDGVLCDTIAAAGDLKWSTVFGDGPSGCAEASWTMALDPNETHPELGRGASVTIRVGPVDVWAGQLVDVSRTAAGWSVTAEGWALDAVNYEALDGSGFTTTNPQVAVPAAIARGWNVVAPSSWPAGFNAAVSAATTGSVNRISTLITAFCDANGLRWGVGADRGLWFRAAPTTPTWVTSPTVAPMGVADDDYVSHLFVEYLNSTTHLRAVSGPTVGSDADRLSAASALQWGRREESLDKTGLGEMSAAAAATLCASILLKTVGRMGWTNPIEATSLELSDMYGVPLAMEQILAGDMLRISGVFDIRGNLTAGTSVDVVLGEVRYENGSDSIYLAPVGLVPRTFTDVLADVPTPEPELVG